MMIMTYLDSLNEIENSSKFEIKTELKSLQ